MKPEEETVLTACFGDLPLPVLAFTPEGDTVYENRALSAMFGTGIEENGNHDRDDRARELALALRPGRGSAIRAAMRGVGRVLPLGSIGGHRLTAQYFPIRCAEGDVTLAGVLLLDGSDLTVPAALPGRGDPFYGGSSAGVEQSLRFILDGMPQLVWSTRPDGYHDFYNRQWYLYTGAPPDATRGAGWNDLLHPDDQQRAWERWKHSLTSGEDYEIEYRFRRADGVYRWFLGRALPMRNERGMIARWFGTCTDVDDQKRLEQHRTEVLAQAEATNRMKDEFLAIVSHELRTPLTAILGWAEAQRARPELAPKAMEIIERNAQAQAKLIQEILETSRIVTGKVRLDLQAADLRDIARGTIDTVRPSAEAKGVALDVSFDPHLGRIVCDPDRLEQIVGNLLVNAIKFTPRGGRVMIRGAAGPTEVSITVADTGKGIPGQFLAHVFEPFRQAESATARQHGGLGLGLAIVKHLVELHGGTISAASEGEGKGATFTVHLPKRMWAATPARPSHETRSFATHNRSEAARLDGVRVLVVDDEPDARELVAMILREAGAETREAGSAASALETMQRQPCDVLVSDIGMPIQDGYSLVRELRGRGHASGGHVPALALTAFTRHEDAERARDAGFQLHLPKPVRPLDLVSAVHKLAHHERGA